MKAIIIKDTKVSTIIAEDDVDVVINGSSIMVGNESHSGYEEGNIEVVENVTPPDDWTGHKYLISDGNWVMNPEWVEHVAEEPVTE